MLKLKLELQEVPAELYFLFGIDDPTSVTKLGKAARENLQKALKKIPAKTIQKEAKKAVFSYVPSLLSAASFLSRSYKLIEFTIKAVLDGEVPLIVNSST